MYPVRRIKKTLDNNSTIHIFFDIEIQCLYIFIIYRKYRNNKISIVMKYQFSVKTVLKIALINSFIKLFIIN